MTDRTGPSLQLPDFGDEATIRATIFAILGITNAVGPISLLSPKPMDINGGLVLLVGGNVSGLGSLALLRIHRQQAAAFLLVAGCLGVVTTIMIQGLGIHDVSAMGLPLVVLMASLLLRRAAYAISLALCAATATLMTWVSSSGRLGRGISDITSMSDGAALLFVLAAVAAFVRTLRNRSQKALGRALLSEDALSHSNSELAARSERLEAQERERVRLIADLESKNRELEKFTYTVSHDLKSPLITIRAYLESIGRDLGEGNERIQEDMRRVAAATERMRQLLDGLLNLSRIGRFLNTPEAVSLRVVAQDAVDLTRGRLAQRRVRVTVAPDLPVVRIDRQRMAEMFVNLLDNAAKFMGPQASPLVEIGMEIREGRRVFCVRDNGIGIDPDHLQKVFELFDRLDPKAEGTGIGLTLARRIVEAHGGRLWAESEGAGHGTTFCFTLLDSLFPGAGPSAPGAGSEAPVSTGG